MDLPIEQVETEELKRIMESCISELSEDYREVILLRLYAKGSWAWVAEQMNRPTEGAARELFRRAKVSLISAVSKRTKI